MVKDILFVPHNHFDPTWRRCFDRPAIYNGVTVRSYAEVEERCFDAWFALAPRGYTFSEGQAVVLRKYLERNPDRRPAVQAMIRAGRLAVMLAGETVQDTALSTAEGLVRNFLVAWPFYRDVVGLEHAGLKLAWLEDAFGNSPNYPQVLRGVGAEVACQFSYRRLAEDVWVGMDGSKILVYDRHPATQAGGFQKHPPCPDCDGAGCGTCGQTGMLLVDGFDLAQLRKAFDGALVLDGDWAAVWLLTEEIMPDARVADLVDTLRREYAGRAEIHYATPLDVAMRHLHVMDDAWYTRDDAPSDDLNPAMPGCMVSRIRNKQRTRAIAYQLLAAESILANSAWGRGVPESPPDDFAPAWRHVVFNQFHDAITGTLIDSANAELMDMLDAAEAVASRYLPLKQARSALGAFKAVDGDEPIRKTLGSLSVTFDRCGIQSINCEGRDLFGVLAPLNNRRRPIRIAELVLEADFGDAWGRRIAPFGGEHNDFSAVPLGDYHTSVETSDKAIRWRGKYTGGDPKVKKLEWTVTVCSSADGNRLNFVTDVNWDTGSRRLRAIVPVMSQDAIATYEVPFGFVDRAFDASKLDYSQWNSNAMEFPTLHWARQAIDASSGVALLNKGLPCYRWIPGDGIQPGRFDLSLARSPEWAFCAVEPVSYEFWDIDGQRDAGKHRFEYSIWPYVKGLAPGDLIRAGYDYNRPAPSNLPFKVSGDVVVTAWKLAEDGSGWILRLQETGGTGTTVTLDFDAPRQVTRTNLLEQPEGELARTGRFETPLHKHGILTLHIL